jgi:hypothetical protein
VTNDAEGREREPITYIKERGIAGEGFWSAAAGALQNLSDQQITLLNASGYGISNSTQEI